MNRSPLKCPKTAHWWLSRWAQKQPIDCHGRLDDARYLHLDEHVDGLR